MANQEHVDLLKQEVKIWNTWREEHPKIIPDLSRADLSLADLHGANLSGADLHGANLYGADLNEANLSEANLSEADLRFADLRDADLRDANLNEATLNEADPRGANLYGANLHRANLHRANLYEVKLYEADLSGTDLRGANLYDGNLSRADLSRADLSGATLSGATLSGADLTNALFDSKSDLKHLILSDKQHGSASLVDVRWNGANLAVVEWEDLRMLGDERGVHGGADKTEGIENCQTAVRANRQLAVALREQGLNEEADRFAYRAQRLKRMVLRRQAFLPKKFSRRPLRIWDRIRFLSGYLFSGFLDVLAGYGYRPERSAFAYLLIIVGFALAYWRLGDIRPLFPDALIFSILSFHGRGFFPSLSAETALHNPAVIIAAFEAIAGLLVEVSLIATFTQRFFAR